MGVAAVVNLVGKNPEPKVKALFREKKRDAELVRPERFELPTCCSGGNRSIQLSYGRRPVF